MLHFIDQRKRSDLNSNKNGTKTTRDILDFALADPEYAASIEELVDQMKTFFFAGHDTTAATISWALYFLHQNPTELEHLRKEHDAVFGAGTSPAEVARKFIEDPNIHIKLEFTLAVVREALRLEPPASLAKTAPKNYYVTTRSGATVHIPEGALIYTSGWMVHHNKQVWGEDADEFKPERFMHGNPIPWGYMPFGKRPRDCIGMNLAYLEVPCSFLCDLSRRKLPWHLLPVHSISSLQSNISEFCEEL